MLYGKDFWVASSERAVKTFAQSLLALFVGDSALNVVNISWEHGLVVAATATLVSFLTSVVSAQVGPAGSPSLVAEPVVEGAVEDEPTHEPEYVAPKKTAKKAVKKAAKKV